MLCYVIGVCVGVFAVGVFGWDTPNIDDQAILSPAQTQTQFHNAFFAEQECPCSICAFA